MKTTIKDVPMLTTDEQEITLNAILYTVEWSSGYNWSKEGKAKIESYRVISVNNSARHFRTRCANGCEQNHEFSKGCSRQQLFGTIGAARKELVKKIEYDLSNATKKAQQIKNTLAHIESQKKLAAKMFPTKEPKAV